MEIKNTKDLFKEMRTGKFFSCGFIKRSNNELRTILARTGVKIGLTGKGSNYSFQEKGLLAVTDIVLYNKTKDINKSRRAIPLDNIIWVKINGKKYFVSDLIIDESVKTIKELNKTILQ